VLFRSVVDFFTLPDNCYLNNAQPSNVTTQAAPALLSIQVWDGPDQTAVMELESGLRSIDMGDAPTITLTGLLKGVKDANTWKFSAQNVAKSTQVGRTVTDDTKVDMTIERANTFKGTATLTSARSCSGSTCMGTQPTCTVSGIKLSGTRIDVKYERAP
jgi:hypothetical protein